PWLVGTALMHSLAVTEKRSAFKAWTVLLAIFAFSLSLLGTFLVRSGVLTSVHAFATDPARGVFILIFLGLVIGGSLTLYAWRAPRIRSVGTFALVSRETALLLNNVILVTACASILLGTLYPLALDALNLGKISVGPPYFNSVFIPLTAPLAVLIGFGILTRWKQDRVGRLVGKLRGAMVVSLVLGVAWVVLLLPSFRLAAVVGTVLAVWVMASSVVALRARLGNQKNPGAALRSIPRGFWGMTLGHMGVGVFIIGITLTSLYSIEKDVRLAPGESFTMAGYRFEMIEVREVQGPNYVASEGKLTVSRDGEVIALLEPQKRIYRVQRMPMTEAAIDAGLTRDLFVALGEPIDDQGAWSVRLYVKPYIRWIWLGALIMAFGGLLAATDRRYRLTARRERAKLPADSAPAGAA
ncbi:MAG TPA: c-type cytochrome biogenesis protein CcmF, partial [Chromatiales bacterium]|nr:c-type cytochrome biogenesis protein CcmF [Chromatiales bacterium]